MATYPPQPTPVDPTTGRPAPSWPPTVDSIANPTPYVAPPPPRPDQYVQVNGTQGPLAPHYAPTAPLGGLFGGGQQDVPVVDTRMMLMALLLLMAQGPSQGTAQNQGGMGLGRPF